jgi:uncharacterized HAD superfamily protein
MIKKVIAIDIDDVLSASAEGFAAFSNKRWNANVTADDYDEDWSKFWKVPLEVALTRREEAHASGTFSTYAVIEKATEALNQLKERFELIVVTSRQKRLKPETDAWLAKHFPDIFSTVHYAGIWDTDDVKAAIKKHKAELCRELGADYLIDDQLKHCLGAAECGMQALLFGNYKWNRSSELPKNITEVYSWDDVLRYFNGKS